MNDWPGPVKGLLLRLVIQGVLTGLSALLADAEPTTRPGPPPVLHPQPVPRRRIGFWEAAWGGTIALLSGIWQFVCACIYVVLQIGCIVIAIGLVWLFLYLLSCLAG